MPAAFPLLTNTTPTDAQARALRAALAREVALQTHLEQQFLEIENEAFEAQLVAASFVACKAASERVHRALDALKAAVQESKDSISSAIDIHDIYAKAADDMTTTAEVRNVWPGWVQALDAFIPQIHAVTNSTESHIRTTSDQVNTYNFVAECARHSIASLDVSLDTIATSLADKRKCFSSIFRIPADVFGIIFQLSVEEERRELHAEFTSPLVSFIMLEDMRRTIPSRPFTLAAVCQRWRDIALNSPNLWSYIRVYTSFRPLQITKKRLAKHHWIGKAAFEWSLQRARGTSLELVFYQDPTSVLLSIPPDTRVSTICLVRLNSIPQCLPSCLHLSLFCVDESASGRDIVDLMPIKLPPSLDGLEEISCTNVHLTLPTTLEFTTFKFCSERSSKIPNIDHLSEKLPKLEYLQLLLPSASVTPTPWNFARTWKSLATLCITSSVLPCLAAGAHEGLLLPSLTTLILAKVFNSFSPNECESIKPILQTLISLDIHAISSSVDPPKLRTFIDWMEGLQDVVLHRSSARKTVEALSIAPVKLTKRLIIAGSVFEGVELQGYSGILKDSDSVSEDSKLPQGLWAAESVPASETVHLENGAIHMGSP